MPRKKKKLDSKELEAKAKRVGKRRKHEFTKEDEKELIRKAQQGDKKAVSKLIEVNDKYLNHFARKRKYETDLDLEDLKQEAVAGLIEAIHKYNFEYDVKLVTYAYFSINRVLNSAVQKNKSLKISQYGFTQYRKVTQIIAEETKRTGIQPSVEKLCELSGYDKKTIESLLNMNNIVSIDSSYEDEENKKTIELDSSLQKTYDEVDDYSDLYLVLKKLNEQQKNILTDYYGLYNQKKKSVVEIRKKYNLTPEELRLVIEKCREIIKENY